MVKLVSQNVGIERLQAPDPSFLVSNHWLLYADAPWDWFGLKFIINVGKYSIHGAYGT